MYVISFFMRVVAVSVLVGNVWSEPGRLLHDCLWLGNVGCQHTRTACGLGG